MPYDISKALLIFQEFSYRDFDQEGLSIVSRTVSWINGILKAPLVFREFFSAAILTNKHFVKYPELFPGRSLRLRVS